MGLFDFIENLFGTSEKVIYPTDERTYSPIKFEFKKNYGLSYSLEHEAVTKCNELINQFYEKEGEYPNRYVLGAIIVNASHKIFWRRKMTGHWIRQRIRHYLFNLYGISYRKI